MDGGEQMHRDKRDWKQVSLGQRWSEARPTKSVVFFSWVGCVVITMIVGFTWGGWVTGSTARSMVDDTIVTRLAPICVVQFSKDLRKDEKLRELRETSTWQGGDYVKKQGWATMPGEAEPVSRVADECAKLLMLQRA
jgi:hypothetical protein